MQLALEVADATEKDVLSAELHGHVLEAMLSPHANFVIQKVIEVLPVASVSFVAEELATRAADVARHRFGCRILCRLVEHHLCGNASSPATSALIEELLVDSEQLIHHNFARHVMELILEHGNVTHKRRVAGAVQKDVFNNAKNRNASYVVERALILCSVADKDAIVSALVRDSERFLMLATHECGCHVVKAAIKTCGERAQQAKDIILAESDRIQTSKYGKRVLDEI